LKTEHLILFFLILFAVFGGIVAADAYIHRPRTDANETFREIAGRLR
jgi:hypothetical protein